MGSPYVLASAHFFSTGYDTPVLISIGRKRRIPTRGRPLFLFRHNKRRPQRVAAPMGRVDRLQSILVLPTCIGWASYL